MVALAEVISIPITVRINPLDNNTSDEIETALDSGAKIIMLPMAKVPSEVDKFISLVNGRAKTLVQIETHTLVEHCHELRDLGWDYSYIGLNDLMISRQKTLFGIYWQMVQLNKFFKF
ncbi:MAG: aldolase/citrate lyase family protein [Microcystis sp. LE17-20A]|uniref:aldolase/citrate lyase family protein n=1 Tax=unclassified Microcystis TaxID=2643300 RepID=UPI0022BAAA55|nr:MULTISPECIES: aldolase/citrate lyase family protein [unclassified Microcystis]MCZ8039726.1 aldolase/citrate lyase family protein [Microcystis sp. LE17-20A]MCZ8212298.1 aldolase/citrate lyase family protein [Microcystis sp. LE19-8.1F]